MKVHKSCCPPTLDHLKNPLPPLNHMEKLIPPLHPLLTKHYHYVLLKYVHTFVIIQGKLEVWISLPVLYLKKKTKGFGLFPKFDPFFDGFPQECLQQLKYIHMFQIGIHFNSKKYLKLPKRPIVTTITTLLIYFLNVTAA